MRYVMQNRISEWSYTSGKVYHDPFNDIELAVIFTEPDGEKKVVPAFWSGDNTWKVRYASAKIGRHHFCTVCSEASNFDLHNQKGELEITPYEGNNSLLKHGPLKINENKHYLEHIDGTPFFWLADTWWMGLVKRLRWPEDFQLLTADRISKGFSVIQIVAGLYPDMPPFDPRGANEAGFPWEEGYTRINPSYFDMADLRISWLVNSGLVPCIVGCWGYFLNFTGIKVMKKHWRYLVARYGAYPVTWCIAGEAIMPYYLSTSKEEDRKNLIFGWTDVTKYVHSIDPHHRPVTLHSATGGSSRPMLEDDTLMDFDMLQTGHSSYKSFANTVKQLVNAVRKLPPMPALVGEVCYEGILGSNGEDAQRFVFWTSLLNGACGHTYGANGIWQVNTKLVPFGSSPHGHSWGDASWEEAYQLPGSRQVGIGKRLLERYPWWKFEPHPEWVQSHWNKEDYLLPCAAGIPGKVCIVFIPGLGEGLSIIKCIETEVSYNAFYFDPRNGKEYDLGKVIPNEKGEWQPPSPPIFQDWVLVLEAKG